MASMHIEQIKIESLQPRKFPMQQLPNSCAMISNEQPNVVVSHDCTMKASF